LDAGDQQRRWGAGVAAAESVHSQVEVLQGAGADVRGLCLAGQLDRLDRLDRPIGGGLQEGDVGKLGGGGGDFAGRQRTIGWEQPTGWWGGAQTRPLLPLADHQREHGAQDAARRQLPLAGLYEGPVRARLPTLDGADLRPGGAYSSPELGLGDDRLRGQLLAQPLEGGAEQGGPGGVGVGGLERAWHRAVLLPGCLR
jgi:hypothetical protein